MLGRHLKIKKIRIITYHKAVNRGAIIQSYGLLLHLKELFPQAEVKIIDYMPLKRRFYEVLRALKIGGIDYWANLKRFVILRKDSENLLDLDKKRFSRIIKELNEADLLVAGSDCVWRISKSFFDNSKPGIYWLNFNTSAKKISYSSSAVGSEESLILKDYSYLKSVLSEFSLLSVRDQYTKSVVESLGVHAYVTPDPAFFISLNDKVVYKDKIKNFFLNKSCPVGIQIYNASYDEHLRFYINNNRERGVVALTNNYASDLNLEGDLNTLQWCNIFGKFTFLVTDSFHGTIFGLRHGIPFISLETPGINETNSKKYDLLKSLGLTELYLNLEKFPKNIRCVYERQKDIETRWEKEILPKVSSGLDLIQKSFDDYDEKLIDLFENLQANE